MLYLTPKLRAAQGRRRDIMDYVRILRVPFHPTCLLLVTIFAVLITIFDAADALGLIAQVFGWMGIFVAQVWIVKYCYVLIEHIADGATEPPTMSVDMLSPFEVRPWVQLLTVLAGYYTCKVLGGNAGLALGVVMLTLLPASIAVLGVGEAYYQAVNPLMLFRLVRGLGPYYLLILASIPLYLGILLLLWRLDVWRIVWHTTALVCEISFFSLVGGCLYLRRRQLGIEPSRSPERTAAREEAERIKVRARMLDDVFQQVRIGKHVEATRPLAKWLSDLDGETAARDAQYIATQALGWGAASGLNTIGSTLVRHLLRAGRPDAALTTFLHLRERSPALTLDSAADLRALIEYAENAGHEQIATSLRLETPVYQPQKLP